MMLLQTTFDKLIGGQWLDALLEVFFQPMGPLFTGIVVMTLVSVIYITSESIELTAVVTMLAGALVVRSAPPQVQRIGFLIFFLGIIVAGSFLYMNRRGV